MKNRGRKTTLAVTVSAALMLAGTASISSQTDLTIDNDGLTLTAGAVSTEQVLSIKLRVNGPGDFSYEERLEDSLIQWVPEGDLADGLYTWEALVVTVEPGAPMRDVAPQRAQSMATQDPTMQSQGRHSSQASIGRADAKAALPQIPIERYYSEDLKSVERRSGRFEVRDGFIVPFEPDGEDLSAAPEPGVFGTIAGAIVDFVIPSAHADNVIADDVTIEEVTPCLRFDDTSFSGTEWSICGFDNNGGFAIDDDSSAQLGNGIFNIEPNAANNTMYLEADGDIGFGTSTPSEPVHIADPVPRIRLEDTTNAGDWYIKADDGAGDFEISDAPGGGGAFVIQAGAPDDALTVDAAGNTGIGTAAPARKLHVLNASGPQLRLQATGPVLRDGDGSTNQGDRGLIGFGGTAELFVGSGGLWFNDDDGEPVIKMNHSASTDALVVDGGGVGIGTGGPSAPLHIVRGNDTANVLVEDTGGLDGQTMFSLVNAGHPKFRMEDTSQPDVRWEFRTAGQGTDRFQINKIGTPTELRLDAGGDLTIGGTLTENSSREVKHGITSVDGQELLKKLDELEIAEWRYNHTPEGRHIGPMAEDWHATFGLGTNNKGVAPRDMAGVALAAIQSLRHENRNALAAIQSLRHENRDLQERIKHLEQRINAAE
jgi:hypothetical protein